MLFRREKKKPVVLFRTPWHRLDDGWSIAGRRYTRMAQMAGCDVRLWSWKPEPVTDPRVLDEFDSDVAARFLPRRWDVYLWSSAIAGWEASEHTFDHVLQSDGGSRVMHVVLERQHIEPQLAEAFNKLDGVWAQCSANKEVLERAGVRNVTLHLHPAFDDDPWWEIPPPTEHRRFLWIGRNEPRKAPDNLVRAFMRAFEPGEAQLTMKLSAYGSVMNRATLEEVVEDQILMEEGCRWWSRGNWQDHIHLRQESLPREEMVQLIAEHDVYCSASRGEGLDLPAYQSKMAGRTLCLTDSGGPRDFIGDGDVLVPARGSMAASYEYWWGEGARYADYDVDELAGALAAVRGQVPRGDRLSGKFAAKRVAKKFRKWVRSISG